MASSSEETGKGLTASEIGKQILGVWSMRSIGCTLIGSAIAGLADWKAVENFVYGGDGMHTPEMMTTFAVGGGFIFVGEFLSNYVQSLKDQSRDRGRSLETLKEIKKGVESLNDTLKDFLPEFRRFTDDEKYKTETKM